MRVCIYDAGAIGRYLGVLLHRAGADVSLVARGPHLTAMQAGGVRLLMEDGQELTARPRCTSDPKELGPQDYVLVCLKAHSIPGVVEHMLLSGTSIC